jgi:hypothetical protein
MPQPCNPIKAAYLIMQESERTFLRPDKTLIYSCATTFNEFVAASPRQEFLEMRLREIRLLPEEQAYFTEYPDLTHWLIVADDGPDSLVVLPVLAHLAAWIPNLTLRVVRDEDALPVLSALAGDEAMAMSWDEADLPLLLSFDDEWQFQEQWGPHPQTIEPYLDRWLAGHQEFERLAPDNLPDNLADGQLAYSRLSEQLLQEMRLWYNSSLNQACGAEVRALLARWHEENDDEL